jgi:catechol 2,3-dioxygenase-like lactoylglutathione lyase family enzyme
MNDHSSITLPGAVPEVPVSDLKAAVDYYRDKLGFDLDWTEEGIGLAGISRGACRLFPANAEYRAHRGNAGPIVIWLNLDSIEAVNELHRDWSGRGVTITSAPETKPYGLHEFTAADLDGNHFRAFYDFVTPQTECK